MAENYSQIEKSISYFINQQFPAIYRENGPELVQLVKDYYKFMETETNQSTYVSRRFYDYKDIDTTIKSLLVFFQKKYLADLELNESIVPFLVKNVLDLYRRKGTKAGIELFFATFYNEYDIDIVYPASKILKPSNSEWKTGTFLQMFPNDNLFYSKTSKEYTYSDLISKNITGSISHAVASVTKINSILINGIYTPIIYLDNVAGKFVKYDDIYTNINGEIVTFGRLNGSLSEFIVDKEGGPDGIKSSGNVPGDPFKVKADAGGGGEGIVVTVSEETDSVAEYTIVDGGFGYTVANTSLIVSDQSIQRAVSDQTVWEYGEVLRDTSGNEGFIVGTNERSIGVKMNGSDIFDQTRAISTVNRSPNIDLKATGIQRAVSAKPSTPSPGPLFPEGSPPDANTMVTAVITDIQTVSLITDIIQPHAGTLLNAADYEVNASMSGSASPININTVIGDAFEETDIEMGKISGFTNINPGGGYNFDIFARAKDDLVSKLQQRNQIVRLVNTPDASLFEKDEIITEVGTGSTGRIIKVDAPNGSLNIIPNTWYGFTGTNNIQKSNGDQYFVGGVSRDYSSTARVFGDNADIDASVDFETGYIETVAINNSGFSYIHDTNGILVDPDDPTKELAFGTIKADTQGTNKGYWKDFTSHIDGYVQKGSESTNIDRINNNFAVAVLAVAFGSPADQAVAGLTSAFEPWLISIASDGYAYGDINSSGSINSDDGQQFALLSTGQNSLGDPAWQTRFDEIIFPSMKLQPWYDSMLNVIYTTVGIDTVYDLEYSSAGMRIQDSNFYQEYSYQIKSTLDKSRYEKLLKENVHLAGTKMFGDFIYKYENTSTIKPRFIRFFNDDGFGTALDIANTATLDASVTNFNVDSTYVTADHVKV